MKNRVLLSPEEFKKKLDAFVDESAESLRKKLRKIKKQRQKNEQSLYV